LIADLSSGSICLSGNLVTFDQRHRSGRHQRQRKICYGWQTRTYLTCIDWGNVDEASGEWVQLPPMA